MWPFYALGKLTRLRHLCSMYRSGMQGQAALIAEFGIRGAGCNFQCNFLGVKVCRKAFVAAVGLSESVLQRCFWSETWYDSSLTWAHGGALSVSFHRHDHESPLIIVCLLFRL